MDDELIILNYMNLFAAVVRRAHMDVELEKSHKRQWNPEECECPHLFLEHMRQVDTTQVPLRRNFESRRQRGKYKVYIGGEA